MRCTKAEALATVLGGRVTPVGVEWIRPDGRIISIGLDGAFLCTSEQAFLCTSEQAYLDFRSRVDAHESPVIDGQWFDDPDQPWGGKEWAQDLSRLLGGDAHHTGGNAWTVDVVRADGRYVRIGAESASIFPSADDFANMRDELAEHFDWC